MLVNWWAYTWGAYIRGAYIRRFTVFIRIKIQSKMAKFHADTRRITIISTNHTGAVPKCVVD